MKAPVPECDVPEAGDVWCTEAAWQRWREMVAAAQEFPADWPQEVIDAFEAERAE